jgi:hypothetical protein
MEVGMGWEWGGKERMRSREEERLMLEGKGWERKENEKRRREEWRKREKKKEEEVEEKE